MKRVIAVLLVGASIGIAACGGAGEESSPEAAASTPAAAGTPDATEAATGGTAVAIKGFAFVPKVLKAKVGERITWTNDDAAPHTVTAVSGGDVDSGTIAQGASFSFTPEQAGTIAYICEIHPSMTGTIEVS